MASLVTPQPLMTVISRRSPSSRAIVAPSAILRRQAEIEHLDRHEPNASRSVSPVKTSVAGPVMRMVSCQSIRQRAAAHRDIDWAVGALRQDSGNRRRAGTGTAGARQARTAFPGAKVDLVPVNDMGDIDVDSFGKEWIGLDHRADGFEIHACSVIDEEHDMRISDVDRDRCVEARPSRRASRAYPSHRRGGSVASQGAAAPCRRWRRDRRARRRSCHRALSAPPRR